MRRRRHRRSAAALSLALGGALLLSGCQNNRTDVTSPAPSPLATASQGAPSPDVTVATTPVAPTEEQAILEQYRKFFAIQTALMQAPAAERPQMFAAVATDPSYSRTLTGMEAADAAGETTYGEIRLNPVVVSIADRTAKVRDCQDTSGAGRLVKETGSKVTVGRTGALALATMVRGDDDIWRVSRVDYQPSVCR